MDWRTWFTRNVTAPQGHEARRPLNLGYALEPRMLFDGAMAATVAEAAQPDAAAAEAQPPAKEVVFIDSAVPDHQQLAQGVKPGVEVVLLDAGGDALAQIADWAANHTGYDAVHIISHGAEGQVRLGNLTLTSANLASYATQLSTLGEVLNPNGDLLLYGCDIAAGSGANLIASLASITGADVAASTDDTGGKGDWQLEANSGSIETGLPLTAQAMAGYGGNLAQVTFNFESGTTGEQDPNNTPSTTVTQQVGSHTLTLSVDRGGLVVNLDTYLLSADPAALHNNVVAINPLAGDLPNELTLSLDSGKTFDLKSLNILHSFAPVDVILTTSHGDVQFRTSNATEGNSVSLDDSKLNGVSWVKITLLNSAHMYFFLDEIVLDNITLPASDHAPTLSATAANPGFTEGGTAVDLFSGVTADANDAGQVFNSMTLTVSNVLSGSQEWLKIDGVEIALSNGNNGSLANGGSYSITLAGSTATVTLSGLSRDNSQMGTLVDGLGYRNTSDNPGSNSRVVTITQIGDNGSSSNSANPGLASSVALTPVNDAPSVTIAGGTTPFTEGPPAAIDNGLTLSDVDSTTLASATVAITGNFQSGQDLLAFTNNGSTMGNISASYNSGTGVLTLSSAGATATLAQWQAALRAVTYANSSDTPNTSTRTVSFTVNDGTDASSASTKIVSVTAANDAPLVTTTGGTTPFTEGTPATIDTALTLSDVDSATLASATVAITGNFQSGQDLLAFTNDGSTMGNISASYNSGTGVLTLSSAGATATLAQWQAALRAVSYANSSENPNTSARTVSFTVNDGTDASSASTKIVSVTAVNDAPQVTTAGGTTPFTEGTPAAIDSSLTLSDVDSATLASATVAITGNFQSGQDLLAFTNDGSTMGNISASYNSGTGVLTLSSAGATATLAQWQAALRAVTYDNSSGTPNTSTRTVNFVVNDGTDASSAATQSVSVAAANDAPQVTTTGGTTPFTEGASATVIDSGLTLTDTDSATLASATVAITGNFQSGQDLLAFTNDGSTMGNISASYNSGTGVLTLTSAGASATLAQWQAALRAVTYANSSESPNTSARTVSFTANDGVTSSSAATRIVSVTAVNDAPQVTTAGGTTPFTEGTPATIDTALTLSDVDSTTLASATVTITGNFQSGQDLLAFTNDGSTMGNISASYNSGTGVLTLTSAGATATLAQWQAALRAVTYANSSENPNISARTVSFTVNDGTDASSASTKIVSVTSVNDAPSVTTAGGTTPFTEGASATVIDSSLTLSDVDSTTLASATVTITGNFQSSQDLLAFTNDGSTMGNISASYNSGTGVLTLSSAGASATLAQWQAALRAVTYANSSENPNTSTRTISFTVNDGTDASSAATQSVSVTAVNDAPVNNLPTNQTAPQNGQLVFSTANGNGISLSDPDATGSLQVTLTASQGTLTLATIAGLSFTLGDGSGDGSMTFTGSQADINTALNGLIFTPTSGYQGAASLQIVTNDQGSSGSGGAQSDTDTLTITVAPSNTSPVTSGIANQSVSEDAVFNFTLPANTFTDNDPGDSLVLSATLANGSALPSWLSFNPATGTFSGTPTNGDVGNIGVRVTATDRSNATVSSTFVLTVVNTNDAPTANSIASQNATSGTPFSFPLPSGSFSDVDAGDSLVLRATLADGSALPGWLSFNPTNGTFSGTPTHGDVGSISIRVTATDLANASASSTFVLSVTTDNHAPTAGSITNQSVNEDAAFSFTLPANTFADVDAGDSLTLSATLADGSAMPGWLSFNPATGTFSGTPANGDVGNISIRVTATDSANASVSSTFVLTVVNTNDAPTAGNIANQSATSGTPLSVSLPSGSFSDVDAGDSLVLSATLADGSALPGWLSFNPATGTFSGTPSNGDVGSLSIRVTATDLANTSASSTFTLTVAQSGQTQGDPEFRVTDGNDKTNSSPLSTQPLTTQPSLQQDALLPSESLLTTSAGSTSVNFAAGTLSHASALANVFGTNRDGSPGSGQTGFNWTGAESNGVSAYWPSSLSEHRPLELFSGGSWNQVLGTGAASPTLTQQLATLQETERSQATTLAQALQGR